MSKKTDKLFYKKLEELPKSYRYDLYNYLQAHTDEFFTNENKATDRRDFDTFQNHACDRKHLVEYGELLLVDLEWNGCRDGAYVICKVTRGRHKLCTGRIVHLKPIMSIAPISDLPKEFIKNGYWLLPVLG